MSLEQIGFYTLSDARAASASPTARLARAELLLTARCNFRCPYCRRVGGDDLPTATGIRLLDLWAQDQLFAVRFSGGEPTLHPGLLTLVQHARAQGIPRIAISTNGSAAVSVYERLVAAGANDFSVSLDACCAADGDRMAGGVPGAWRKVSRGIAWLAQRVYTTVGIVLTEDNAATVTATIQYAVGLGVHDIRVIPAAQSGTVLPTITVDPTVLARFPILRYRLANLRAGRPVRGLQLTDPRRCGLVVDDLAVMGDHHYPCVIYLREGGAPIGPMNGEVRAARAVWAQIHNTHADPICRRNCLDVCVDYNRAYHTAHAPAPRAEDR